MRHFTTLIDANTLSEQLSREDLTLFDCRFDLGNVNWQPEDVLGNEDEVGIVALNCAPEETSGVFGGRRDGNLQARRVGKICLVCLAMPHASSRQVGSVGSVDHAGALP